MKKLSRRDLFQGAGTAAVGGVALVVGLKPTSIVRKTSFLVNGRHTLKAVSRVGKTGWSDWYGPFTHPLSVPPLSINGVVQLVEPDGTLRTIIQVR